MQNLQRQREDLGSEKSVCFATSLEISCVDCKAKKNKLHLGIIYNKKKLRAMDKNTKALHEAHKRARISLNHKQRQLKSLHNSSSTSSLLENEAFRENHAFRYQINMRMALAYFPLGTGGADIGAAACFLGIPGGRSWERIFHRHIAE